MEQPLSAVGPKHAVYVFPEHFFFKKTDPAADNKYILVSSSCKVML